MGRFDLRHKETIRLFLREFFEIFFPHIAPFMKFDTAQFLDKELIALFEDSEAITGKDRTSRTDMLIMVEVENDGRDEVVLLHWEQEGKRDGNFARRMFYYFCGSYYKYQKVIFPIAMFTDKANWSKRIPVTYTLSLFDYPVCQYRFHLIKLKDYPAKPFSEYAPENPLTWAYLPLTRYARKERPEIAARAKLGVIKLVQDRQKRATLLSLIDHSLDLNQSELEIFNNIISSEEKFRKVKMLQSIEELGYEKGHDQGIQQGMKQGEDKTYRALARALKKKGMSAAEIMEITGLVRKEIEELE